MKIAPALWVIAAITFSGSSLADNPMSGSMHCKSAAEPTPAAIGDKPDHAYAVATQKCTWTKPFRMAGLTAKDGNDTAVIEISGNMTSENGYHVGAMSNGDKYVVKFTGKSSSTDGKPGPSSGTWTFTEGTGKLKGLMGKGTYKGKPNSDGSTTTDVMGEYLLP